MADLIDRAALISEYDRVHIGPSGRARKLMEEAPSIDVAAIVRCRDCIGKSTWYKDAAYGFDICGISGMYPKSENDYCSYGERRKDA